ncbi:MAG: hypothetical protein WC749_10385 [Dehalococcoidia bacterium]
MEIIPIATLVVSVLGMIILGFSLGTQNATLRTELKSMKELFCTKLTDCKASEEKDIERLDKQVGNTQDIVNKDHEARLRVLEKS